MKKLFVFLVFISNIGITQNSVIPDSVTYSSDKIVNFIQQSYSNPSEKIGVIYNWITNHIAYDVDNMFALDRRIAKEDIIKNTLSTRKAICSGYAELFTDLCTKCNITCYTVFGFTKQADNVAYIGHAWNIVYINNAYKIYDATWGSGVVLKNKFIKKPNKTYYNQNALPALRTHYPYDPLWQLLYYPINQDAFFRDMIKEDKSTSYFNFPDSIAVFNQQDSLSYFSACFKRMEKNGIKNTLTYEYITYLQREINYLKNKKESLRKNAVINQYNRAINTYNKTTNLFNDYLGFKNKQFSPQKPDSAIKKIITDIQFFYTLSQLQTDSAKSTPEESLQANLISLQNLITTLKPRLTEETEFAAKYLATPTRRRKSLFINYTLWGIPINNKK